jgi:hypothetical protein
VIDSQSTRELLKAEFDRLKAEQTQRIGFRDNMIFVQFAAIGAVSSWVFANLDKPASIYALLLIPWVCVALGWTYVVNDHMISRIGRYFRWVMDQRARTLAQFDPIELTEKDDSGKTIVISEAFGWEPFHRVDSRRRSRKRIQLAIDELTFFLPGLAALVSFWILWCSKLPTTDKSLLSVLALITSVVELILLCGLAWLIWVYTDMGSTKDTAAPESK